MDSPRQISAREIEVALQRSWWKLKFPAALEAVFESETGPARCRRLIIYGFVALLLYDAYLLSDLRLVPDIFASAVLIRLGVVTPLFLAFILVLRFNPPPALRELLQAGIIVVVTTSILWLAAVSQSPAHVYRHVGVILVILFANVVLRIRFWYATAASLVSLAIYVAIVIQMQELPFVARMTAIAVLANVALFTLMANHALERDTRREFLFRMQDRLRRDELEKMAHRDPLTGIGNRRHLNVSLDQLCLEARVCSETIALLMLDLDNFKAFNDRYGHLAGDTCLKRVSAIVSAELRGPEDVVARFGGEELVMVLVDTELGEGVAIAERIRRAVEAIGIPHGGSPNGVVTVSIGVTAGIPGPELAQDGFLAAADAALYAAKRAGRNQVWPPLPGTSPGARANPDDQPLAKAG